MYYQAGTIPSVILLSFEELVPLGFFVALRALVLGIFQRFRWMKTQKHGGKVFLAACKKQWFTKIKKKKKSDFAVITRSFFTVLELDEGNECQHLSGHMTRRNSLISLPPSGKASSVNKWSAGISPSPLSCADLSAFFGWPGAAQSLLEWYP